MQAEVKYFMQSINLIYEAHSSAIYNIEIKQYFIILFILRKS